MKIAKQRLLNKNNTIYFMDWLKILLDLMIEEEKTPSESNERIPLYIDDIYDDPADRDEKDGREEKRVIILDI